jgi:hypothetical protein
MSTGIVAQRVAQMSPRSMARIAGALYLVIIVVAGWFELFVRGALIVNNDAATTAANILAHESLYRLAGAAVLVYVSCDAVVAVIFYELLKPVTRSVSLLAAFFRLTMVAILSANLLTHFAALMLLKAPSFLNAFNADQLQALALACLNLYPQGFFMGMVFFGFHCLLVGYLICRSAFLPRILGVLMAIAGLCYLTHSFVRFLSPAVAAGLFQYIMLPVFVAEMSLTLWLLVVGLNVQRWKEQAGVARTVI